MLFNICTVSSNFNYTLFTLGKLPEMNSRRAFIVILLVCILFTYIHQQQFNVRKNYTAYLLSEYSPRIALLKITAKSDELSISVQKKGKESKRYKPKFMR